MGVKGQHLPYSATLASTIFQNFVVGGRCQSLPPSSRAIPVSPSRRDSRFRSGMRWESIRGYLRFYLLTEVKRFPVAKQVLKRRRLVHFDHHFQVVNLYRLTICSYRCMVRRHGDRFGGNVHTDHSASTLIPLNFLSETRTQETEKCMVRVVPYTLQSRGLQRPTVR